MADPSVDPRQRRILAGLLAVIGSVLWAQFFLIPQAATAGHLGDELKKMRGQVERARRDLRQMPELENKMETLTAQYSVPSLDTPPEEQLPDLLDRIALAARTAHVRVVALRPKQDLAQVRTGSSGYLEIPLELTATAGYHQIGRFLDELERSGSLVRLREFEIRPSGQDIWNHTVKMLLMAFLIPPDGGKR